MYEVIRCYRGHLFETEAHVRRMTRSLHEMAIGLPDEFDYVETCLRLIEENRLAETDATVYLQITRGAARRKHAFPEPGTPPTLYGTAQEVPLPLEKWQTGVHVILVPDTRWTRCDIKSISLLPNVLANQRAMEAGVDEAVFVRNGTVTEGTHTNVAAVFDGVLYTHPLTNGILPGVTRGVTLRLARRLGIPVQEFPFFEHEVARADEMMLLATTMEVMPIVSVDGRPVADGKPGPIARRLQAAFREEVRRAF